MLHIALILDGDEICHVVVRASRSDLTGRLARYASEHASFQLSAREEVRLRRLLAEGRDRQAVDLYFRRGGRWAPERLIERQVPLPEAVLHPIGR